MLIKAAPDGELASRQFGEVAIGQRWKLLNPDGALPARHHSDQVDKA
jgi:hypothetical protein